MREITIVFLREEEYINDETLKTLQTLLQINFCDQSFAERNGRLLAGKKVIYVGQMYLKDDIKDYLIFAYPKYMKMNIDIHQLKVKTDTELSDEQQQSIYQVKQELKIISRVIELSSYKKENYYGKFNIFYRGSKEAKVSLISIAEYLLKDFSENGQYIFEENADKVNGIGSTNWVTTINKCTPLIQNQQIVYPDVITNEYVEDCTSEVYKAYLYAINEAYKGFSELLNYRNIEIPLCFDDNLNTSTVLHTLRGFLSQIFDERGFLLINALCAWYELKSIYHEDFYGTTNFSKIWEEVCQAVFYNNDKLWKGYMRIPQWNLFCEDMKNIIPSFDDNAKSLEPDITYIDKENNLFFILDAKYYNPRKSNFNHYFGLPGTSDISKQILYYSQLYEKYGNNYKYLNALLLPKYTEKETWLLEYVGYTHMLEEKAVYSMKGNECNASESSDDINDIKIYFVNTYKIYNEYLNNGVYFDSIVGQIAYADKHEFY